jgi:hypothetical protein
MPPVLSTLRSSEGRLAFLERKRKAELKRMGTKEVPILFWTQVPQQGADEEDTEAYLYVPISIAPGAKAKDISRKDLCSAKIQKFQGGSPENCIAAGGWTCRSCSLQEIAITFWT